MEIYRFPCQDSAKHKGIDIEAKTASFEFLSNHKINTFLAIIENVYANWKLSTEAANTANENKWWKIYLFF